MTIRAMRLTDAEAVAELTTQLGYPVDAATQRTRIAAIEARPADDTLLVATDDLDRAIGWIHIGREPSLVASGQASINGLIVADGHRSDGIGAALLEAGERWARDAGCAALVVRSRVQREGAHRFYERSGYERVKTSHVFEKRLN